MHLGEFKQEVEYLDPGLPVEAELVEADCPSCQLTADEITQEPAVEPEQHEHAHIKV